MRHIEYRGRLTSSDHIREVCSGPAPRALPETTLEVAPIGDIDVINSIGQLSAARGDRPRINETELGSAG